MDTPSLYPECNVNPPDGQYALLQDCERRGGPPLSPPKRPPVLGQAGATVMGREKQQEAAKDVTNTTPLSRGGEASPTEAAAAVYLPHGKCQWKQSCHPIHGERSPGGPS